jgi:hypothetical protein
MVAVSNRATFHIARLRAVWASHFEAAKRGAGPMRSGPSVDAVIDYAKRVKDWPTLEIAVDRRRTGS